MARFKELLKQFSLFLWKNLLIQRRTWIWTSIEVLAPICLAVVLVSLRTLAQPEDKDAKEWPSFGVTGTLEHDKFYYAFNCFFPSTLAFTPNNSFTREIMDIARQKLGHGIVEVKGSPLTLKVPAKVEAFATEDAMVSHILAAFNDHAGDSPENLCNHFKPMPYIAAVVFETNVNEANIGETVRYRLRFSNTGRNIQQSSSSSNESGIGAKFIQNYNREWETKFTYPFLPLRGPRNPNDANGGRPGYFNEGFLTVQKAINYGIMKHVAKEHNVSSEAIASLDVMQLSMRRYPYPEYRRDPFISVLQQQFASFMLLGYCIAVLYVTRNIVLEKENRVREYMRVMGLSNGPYWAAHFLSNFGILFIVSCVMTALLTIPFEGSGTGTINRTHWSVLLVFILLYSFATICFSFAVSSFFDKGTVAAGCAFFIWFVMNIPYVFLRQQYSVMSRNAKVGASILMNVAMPYGCYLFGAFEGTGRAKVGASILMNVAMPYGCYLFGAFEGTGRAKVGASILMNVAMPYGCYLFGAFEGTENGLHWSNLHTPPSVDDNLCMLDVFVMLIVDSALCLLIAWYVDNVNPGGDAPAQKWYFPFTITYWLGREPQSTRIMPTASAVPTVIHLEANNFEKDPINEAADVFMYNLTKVFGSGDAAKTAVNGLSLKVYNGQVTALLGHNGAGKSTTLSILTGIANPTSGSAEICGHDIRTGLDKIRHIVGFCPQYNVFFDRLTVEEHLRLFCQLKGRVFTTYDCDRLLEAMDMMKKKDAPASTLSGGMKRKLCLGIALIGGSRVVFLDEPTSGMDPGARKQTWDLIEREKKYRSMLLTTHYMEEADVLGDRIAIMAHGTLECCGSPLFLKSRYGAGYHVTVTFTTAEDDLDDKMAATEALIRKCLPAAVLVSRIGAEARFLLPSELKEKFEHLFGQLENQQDELSINSLGCSITTMEEVFVRVNEDADKKRTTADVFDSKSMGVDEFRITSDLKNTGFKLYAQHFYSQLIKRFQYTRRSYGVLVAQVLVPVVLMLLLMILLRRLPGQTASQALRVSLEKYKQPIMYAASTDDRESSLSILSNFMEQSSDAADVLEKVGFDEPQFMDFLLELARNKSKDQYNVHELTTLLVSHNDTADQTHLLGLFNNQPLHVPPLILQLIDNAVLATLLNDSAAVAIEVVNDPLPPASEDKMQLFLARGVQDFNIAFILVIGYSFLASGFVVFLIRERVTGAKHLQALSGLSTFVYWASNFVIDYITYAIPAAVLIIIFAGYNIDELGGAGNWPYTLLVFAIYGYSMIAFMYSLTFWFDSPTAGFVIMVIFNLMSGMIPLIVNTVLQLLDYHDAAKIVRFLCMILFPNYAGGQAIATLYLDRYTYSGCSSLDLDKMCSGIRNRTEPGQVGGLSICCEDDSVSSNPLRATDNGIGRFIIALSMRTIVSFFLIYSQERQLLRKLIRRIVGRIRARKARNSNSLRIIVDAEETENHQREILMRTLSRKKSVDQDVLTEAATVRSGEAHVLTLDGVQKWYNPQMCAVNGITFAVDYGQCFGLLGINGAGKTSTFRMLVGDLEITKGRVRICGNDVATDWKKACQNVGYCPQFDAVLDLLTGRETLTLFSRLRGIPEACIADVVNSTLKALGMTSHASKLIRAYSGGNKRKLSLAVTLIGNPPLLLLDEPTAGVDPSTRRFVWQVLSRIRQLGTAVVLSSHSMEECEALCTKLTIMHKGKLQCIGTTQHLKSKYGVSYTVCMKIPHVDDASRVTAAMKECLPRAELAAIHATHPPILQYEVPVGCTKWSQLFGVVNLVAQRADINLVDYSVSQTTLEQVFLNITRT